MSLFTHLHVHTEYSLLDGLARIEHLMDTCKAQGMTSIAMTDHGVMYGAVAFYKQAKKHGIHPILGCEVYVAPTSMEEKRTTGRDYAHLILLAETQEGYENLSKLVSLGFLKGFYYRPRIDYEVLKEYSKGLIGLSACLAGDIPQLLLANRIEEAESLTLKLKNIFGENNFFLELQDHGLAEQRKVNPLIISLAERTGVPLVATNDVHYINKKDAKAHEIMLCIQTGRTMDDPERMRFETEEFYLKSPEEMQKLFAYCPSACENTEKIAQRCHVDFDFSKVHLPGFGLSGDEAKKELKRLSEEGLKKKYKTVTSEMKDRLSYELTIIDEMGYIDYFLIVWDFIRYAKENGIMVGPGRGSAAGSIVAYALNITTVDPLAYNLLFERFLNPERVSMPDIDIDFCYERRQEVIDYVVSKYGSDHVAQIITFGTMKARAVTRDVGRALNIAYAEVDQIAKMIPMDLGITLEKALQLNPDLKQLYDEKPLIHQLLETAQILEGMPRHASTHAAGVVITEKPVWNYVPLQTNDNVVMTQFPMGTLEELGLLKMDFLGLRTLTVIRDAIALVREKQPDFDMDTVSFDDADVYKLLAEGDTDGVFQLESAGMRQVLKELNPDRFEDIIACISLYRPGPMQSIPRYIKGKNNPASVQHSHPLVENVLRVTYGCMVYQEQVMQLVRDLAGYSLGRSDLVRRAMSKKKQDVMEKERKIFIHGLVENEKVIVAGCIRNGVPELVASDIFDEMTAFAQYAFNKSHAACYAVIAYQTAYLKAHYPVEFMAAILNSEMGNNDKIALYIHYCRKHDIEVLPPDVNESFAKFSVAGKNIRFGLGAVKNIGLSAVESIVCERQTSGNFTDFRDFCLRCAGDALNKRVLENLIYAGAFDSMGYTRAQLIAVYERILEGAMKEVAQANSGQMSLWDVGGEQPVQTIEHIKEYPPHTLLQQEKDVLGVYVSGHPLEAYMKELDLLDCTTLLLHEEDESLFPDGKMVLLGGIVTTMKLKMTRNNARMAFITLEDLYGTIEVIVFPKIFENTKALLQDEKLIVVRGKVSRREDRDVQLVAEEIAPLEKGLPLAAVSAKRQNAPLAESKTVSRIYLRIKRETNCTMEQLSTVIKKYKGPIPVYIYQEEEKRSYKLSGFGAIPGLALEKEIETILGEDCLRYQ